MKKYDYEFGYEDYGDGNYNGNDYVKEMVCEQNPFDLIRWGAVRRQATIEEFVQYYLDECSEADIHLSENQVRVLEEEVRNSLQEEEDY